MLEDLALPVKKPNCRVRTVKAELSDKDAAILEEAVMNPAWPYRTLENALSSKGVAVSERTIKQHREKRCSCWKD